MPSLFQPLFPVMRKSKSPASLLNWRGSRRRMTTRVISLVITLAFVFPYLTWAFQPSSYPQAVNQIHFERRPVDIPAAFGSVLDAHQGREGLVICVQDLHCNYEVQSNIARLIDWMAAKHGLSLVAVEGADRAVDVSLLSSLTQSQAKKMAGDYLLKEGKITGAEWYAAVGKHAIRLEGIETAALYEANYASIMKFLNDESQGYVFDLREALQQIKPAIYQGELRALDERKTAYRDGELALQKYAAFLCQSGARARLDLSGFANLERYVSRRDGRFDAAVDADGLYAELEQLDQALRARLYATPEQKELNALEHRLDVMEKLVNISAVPEEIAEYRSNPGAFRVNVFREFIGRRSAQAVPDEDVQALNGYLDEVAEFYRVADRRSAAFVENLKRRMRAQGTNLSLLVAGGYHTGEVTAELKKQGLSYISVKPRLEHQDLVNPYFALLRGRKTPLEKLLAQNQNIFAPRSNFVQGGPLFTVLVNTVKALSAIEVYCHRQGVRASEAGLRAYLNDVFQTAAERFLTVASAKVLRGRVLVEFSLGRAADKLLGVFGAKSGELGTAAETELTLDGRPVQMARASEAGAVEAKLGAGALFGEEAMAVIFAQILPAIMDAADIAAEPGEVIARFAQWARDDLEGLFAAARVEARKLSDEEEKNLWAALQQTNSKAIHIHEKTMKQTVHIIDSLEGVTDQPALLKLGVFSLAGKIYFTRRAWDALWEKKDDGERVPVTVSNKFGEPMPAVALIVWHEFRERKDKFSHRGVRQWISGTFGVRNRQIQEAVGMDIMGSMEVLAMKENQFDLLRLMIAETKKHPRADGLIAHGRQQEKEYPNDSEPLLRDRNNGVIQQLKKKGFIASAGDGFVRLQEKAEAVKDSIDELERFRLGVAAPEEERALAGALFGEEAMAAIFRKILVEVLDTAEVALEPGKIIGQFSELALGGEVFHPEKENLRGLPELAQVRLRELEAGEAEALKREILKMNKQAAAKQVWLPQPSDVRIIDKLDGLTADPEILKLGVFTLNGKYLITRQAWENLWTRDDQGELRAVTITNERGDQVPAVAAVLEHERREKISGKTHKEAWNWVLKQLRVRHADLVRAVQLGNEREELALVTMIPKHFELLQRLIAGRDQDQRVKLSDLGVSHRDWSIKYLAKYHWIEPAEMGYRRLSDKALRWEDQILEMQPTAFGYQTPKAAAAGALFNDRTLESALSNILAAAGMVFEPGKAVKAFSEAAAENLKALFENLQVRAEPLDEDAWKEIGPGFNSLMERAGLPALAPDTLRILDHAPDMKAEDADLPQLGAFNLNRKIYLSRRVYEKLRADGRGDALAAIVLHEWLEVQGMPHTDAVVKTRSHTGLNLAQLTEAAGLDPKGANVKLLTLPRARLELLRRMVESQNIKHQVTVGTVNFSLEHSLADVNYSDVTRLRTGGWIEPVEDKSGRHVPNCWRLTDQALRRQEQILRLGRTADQAAAEASAPAVAIEGGKIIAALQAEVKSTLPESDRAEVKTALESLFGPQSGLLEKIARDKSDLLAAADDSARPEKLRALADYIKEAAALSDETARALENAFNGTWPFRFARVLLEEAEKSSPETAIPAAENKSKTADRRMLTDIELWAAIKAIPKNYGAIKQLLLPEVAETPASDLTAAMKRLLGGLGSAEDANTVREWIQGRMNLRTVSYRQRGQIKKSINPFMQQYLRFARGEEIKRSVTQAANERETLIARYYFSRLFYNFREFGDNYPELSFMQPIAKSFSPQDRKDLFRLWAGDDFSMEAADQNRAMRKIRDRIAAAASDPTEKYQLLINQIQYSREEIARLLAVYPAEEKLWELLSPISAAKLTEYWITANVDKLDRFQEEAWKDRKQPNVQLRLGQDAADLIEKKNRLDVYQIIGKSEAYRPLQEALAQVPPEEMIGLLAGDGAGLRSRLEKDLQGKADQKIIGRFLADMAFIQQLLGFVREGYRQRVISGRTLMHLYLHKSILYPGLLALQDAPRTEWVRIFLEQIPEEYGLETQNTDSHLFGRYEALIAFLQDAHANGLEPAIRTAGAARAAERDTAEPAQAAEETKTLIADNAKAVLEPGKTIAQASKAAAETLGAVTEETGSAAEARAEKEFDGLTDGARTLLRDILECARDGKVKFGQGADATPDLEGVRVSDDRVKELEGGGWIAKVFEPGQTRALTGVRAPTAKALNLQGGMAGVDQEAAEEIEAVAEVAPMRADELVDAVVAELKADKKEEEIRDVYGAVINENLAKKISVYLNEDRSQERPEKMRNLIAWLQKEIPEDAPVRRNLSEFDSAWAGRVARKSLDLISPAEEQSGVESGRRPQVRRRRAPAITPEEKETIVRIVTETREANFQNFRTALLDAIGRNDRRVQDLLVNINSLVQGRSGARNMNEVQTWLLKNPDVQWNPKEDRRELTRDFIQQRFMYYQFEQQAKLNKPEAADEPAGKKVTLDEVKARQAGEETADEAGPAKAGESESAQAQTAKGAELEKLSRQSHLKKRVREEMKKEQEKRDLALTRTEGLVIYSDAMLDLLDKLKSTPATSPKEKAAQAEEILKLMITELGGASIKDEWDERRLRRDLEPKRVQWVLLRALSDETAEPSEARTGKAQTRPQEAQPLTAEEKKQRIPQLKIRIAEELRFVLTDSADLKVREKLPRKDVEKYIEILTQEDVLGRLLDQFGQRAANPNEQLRYSDDMNVFASDILRERLLGEKKTGGFRGEFEVPGFIRKEIQDKIGFARGRNKLGTALYQAMFGKPSRRPETRAVRETAETDAAAEINLRNVRARLVKLYTNSTLYNIAKGIMRHSEFAELQPAVNGLGENWKAKNDSWTAIGINASREDFTDRMAKFGYAEKIKSGIEIPDDRLQGKRLDEARQELYERLLDKIIADREEIDGLLAALDYSGGPLAQVDRLRPLRASGLTDAFMIKNVEGILEIQNQMADDPADRDRAKLDMDEALIRAVLDAKCAYDVCNSLSREKQYLALRESLFALPGRKLIDYLNRKDAEGLRRALQQGRKPPAAADLDAVARLVEDVDWMRNQVELMDAHFSVSSVHRASYKHFNRHKNETYAALLSLAELPVTQWPDAFAESLRAKLGDKIDEQMLEYYSKMIADMGAGGADTFQTAVNDIILKVKSKPAAKKAQTETTVAQENAAEEKKPAQEARPDKMEETVAEKKTAKEEKPAPAEKPARKAEPAAEPADMAQRLQAEYERGYVDALKRSLTDGPALTLVKIVLGETPAQSRTALEQELAGELTRRLEANGGRVQAAIADMKAQGEIVDRLVENYLRRDLEQILENNPELKAEGARNQQVADALLQARGSYAYAKGILRAQDTERAWTPEALEEADQRIEDLLASDSDLAKKVHEGYRRIRAVKEAFMNNGGDEAAARTDAAQSKEKVSPAEFTRIKALIDQYDSDFTRRLDGRRKNMESLLKTLEDNGGNLERVRLDRDWNGESAKRLYDVLVKLKGEEFRTRMERELELNAQVRGAVESEGHSAERAILKLMSQPNTPFSDRGALEKRLEAVSAADTSIGEQVGGENARNEVVRKALEANRYNQDLALKAVKDGMKIPEFLKRLKALREVDPAFAQTMDATQKLDQQIKKLTDLLACDPALLKQVLETELSIATLAQSVGSDPAGIRADLEKNHKLPALTEAQKQLLADVLDGYAGLYPESAKNPQNIPGAIGRIQAELQEIDQEYAAAYLREQSRYRAVKAQMIAAAGDVAAAVRRLDELAKQYKQFGLQLTGEQVRQYAERLAVVDADYARKLAEAESAAGSRKSAEEAAAKPAGAAEERERKNAVLKRLQDNRETVAEFFGPLWARIESKGIPAELLFLSAAGFTDQEMAERGYAEDQIKTLARAKLPIALEPLKERMARIEDWSGIREFLKLNQDRENGLGMLHFLLYARLLGKDADLQTLARCFQRGDQDPVKLQPGNKNVLDLSAAVVKLFYGRDDGWIEGAPENPYQTTGRAGGTVKNQKVVLTAAAEKLLNSLMNPAAEEKRAGREADARLFGWVEALKEQIGAPTVDYTAEDVKQTVPTPLTLELVAAMRKQMNMKMTADLPVEGSLLLGNIRETLKQLEFPAATANEIEYALVFPDLLKRMDTYTRIGALRVQALEQEKLRKAAPDRTPAELAGGEADLKNLVMYFLQQRRALQEWLRDVQKLDPKSEAFRDALELYTRALVIYSAEDIIAGEAGNRETVETAVRQRYFLSRLPKEVQDILQQMNGHAAYSKVKVPNDPSSKRQYAGLRNHFVEAGATAEAAKRLAALWMSSPVFQAIIQPTVEDNSQTLDSVRVRLANRANRQNGLKMETKLRNKTREELDRDYTKQVQIINVLTWVLGYLLEENRPETAADIEQALASLLLLTDTRESEPAMETIMAEMRAGKSERRMPVIQGQEQLGWELFQTLTKALQKAGFMERAADELSFALLVPTLINADVDHIRKYGARLTRLFMEENQKLLKELPAEPGADLYWAQRALAYYDAETILARLQRGEAQALRAEVLSHYSPEKQSPERMLVIREFAAKSAEVKNVTLKKLKKEVQKRANLNSKSAENLFKGDLEMTASVLKEKGFSDEFSLEAAKTYVGTDAFVDALKARKVEVVEADTMSLFGFLEWWAMEWRQEHSGQEPSFRDLQAYFDTEGYRETAAPAADATAAEVIGEMRAGRSAGRMPQIAGNKLLGWEVLTESVESLKKAGLSEKTAEELMLGLAVPLLDELDGAAVREVCGQAVQAFLAENRELQAALPAGEMATAQRALALFGAQEIIKKIRAGEQAALQAAVRARYSPREMPAELMDELVQLSKIDPAVKDAEMKKVQRNFTRKLRGVSKKIARTIFDDNFAEFAETLGETVPDREFASGLLKLFFRTEAAVTATNAAGPDAVISQKVALTGFMEWWMAEWRKNHSADPTLEELLRYFAEDADFQKAVQAAETRAAESGRKAALLPGLNVGLGAVLAAAGAGLALVFLQQFDASIFAGVVAGLAPAILGHELAHKLWMPGSRIDWRNLQVIPAQGRPLTREQALAGPVGGLLTGALACAPLALVSMPLALGMLLTFVSVNMLSLFAAGDADVIWWRETSQPEPFQMRPLRSLLGPARVNEPLYSTHVIGRQIDRLRGYFGEKFNLLDNVRVGIGSGFQVGWAEMETGAADLEQKELQPEDAAFVITIPKIFRGVLEATPETEGVRGLGQRLQRAVVGWALGAKLRAYTRESARLAGEVTEEDADLLAEYPGEKLVKRAGRLLRALGGQMPADRFYRPQGGRKIGLTGAELGTLLESFRQTLGAEEPGLWQAVEGPLTALLEKGQAPASDKLVQALMNVKTDEVADAALRLSIAGLQAGIQQAQAEAERTGDAERLYVEVSHAAALIIRSRERMLGNVLLATQAVTASGTQQAYDTVRMLADAAAQKEMIEAVAEMMKKAPANTALRANLEFLRTVLGKTELGAEEGARLQRLLQAAGLPQDGMAVAPVGWDVTDYAGSLVNARVDVKTLTAGGMKLEVAKPVVATVLAPSEEAIRNLNRPEAGRSTVSVIQYRGRLPETLKPAGNFRSEIAKYLADSAVFKDCLADEGALAQSYFKWRGHPDRRTNQRMARTLLRILNYEAKKLERDAARQADYDAALAAVNALFASSKAFAGESVKVGAVGDAEFTAPATLSRGGLWAYVALCGKHSGDFTVNEDLDKLLRQERLRNFRISSAA